MTLDSWKQLLKRAIKNQGIHDTDPLVETLIAATARLRQADWYHHADTDPEQLTKPSVTKPL
jgi:hypothetical protein